MQWVQKEAAPYITSHTLLAKAWSRWRRRGVGCTLLGSVCVGGVKMLPFASETKKQQRVWSGEDHTSITTRVPTT